MRQRKVVIGLLVVAALSLGLVPVAGTAGPEKAWVCVAVWNGVNNQCTTTASRWVLGGAIWHGAYEVFSGTVKTCWNYTADDYHFSTVPIPPSDGAVECRRVGSMTAAVTITAKALGPGSIVIVGSRGEEEPH